MRRTFEVLLAGSLMLGGLVAVASPTGAAKPSSNGPNPCTLVTASDITATFTAQGLTTTPSTVGTPTKSKPTNQGGFGPSACETSFALPNSIEGSVVVFAPKLLSGESCPASGQPGKKTKVGSTRALIEFTPSTPKVVRDITFPKGKACVTVEIFLSSSEGTVPPAAFVGLAKAALAKKG
jgi:hypothetical protein